MPDRASSKGRAIRQATCDYYNRSKSSIYNQKNATGIRVGSIFLLSANDVEICQHPGFHICLNRVIIIAWSGKSSVSQFCT